MGLFYFGRFRITDFSFFGGTWKLFVEIINIDFNFNLIIGGAMFANKNIKGNAEVSVRKSAVVFEEVILILILLNTLAVILDTVRSIHTNYQSFLKGFEFFSVIVFSIEYIFRLSTCIRKEKYKSPIIGRAKYIVSPMALIDLFAVLPFYLPFLISVDLRFLRILRIARIFRILKIARYSSAVEKMGRVFKAKKEELLITIGSVFVLIIISSSLIYHVENAAQPQVFSSIPASMWWAVTTLTTVGYGDAYPVTPLGKIIGSFIAILGIGLVALPAGIISSGFMEEVRNSKKDKKICPHCGKSLDE